MPKKKPPDPNEKPQHDRFKEAAKQTGADETGEAFERAFGKIVPPAQGKSPRETQSSPKSRSRPKQNQ
jgi:hypothetical protein